MPKISSIIDTARIDAVHGIWNDRATGFGLPSVRPFVCMFHRSTAAAEGSEFAAERPAGRTRRSTAPAPSSNGAAARRSAANAGSVMLTAE